MRVLDLLSTSKIIEIGKAVDPNKNVTLKYCIEDRDEPFLSFYYCACASDAIYDDDGYAVVTDVEEFFLSHPNAIWVENARFSMAEAYRILCGIDKSKIKLVGVTGTNGKTTTATIIYKVLLFSGIKSGFIGTGKIEFCQNIWSDELYSMTTPPPSILFPALKRMVKEGGKYCIMEVSSHSLAQSRLGLLEFEIGIFTNLSSEHTDFHENMEEYFKEKCKLFNSSLLAIINIDDEYGLRAYKMRKNSRISFGIQRPADYSITRINSKGLNGQEFFIKAASFITRIKSMLPALHNTYNIGLAFIALVQLGLSPTTIKTAISKITFIPGRLEIIHRSPTVIIDYAHTPLAIKYLLEFVSNNKSVAARVISVVGCGGERDKGKRPVIGEIVSEYSDYTIITEDNSRGESTEEIIKSICYGIPKNSNYSVIPDREKAIIAALDIATKWDIVLMIGKGHEEYLINNTGVRYFSEKEIVKGYYKEPI